MMNKIFTTLFICSLAVMARAQTTPAAKLGVESYGKVTQADLDLKQCDFEKDANAEVLFDKGVINLVPDQKVIDGRFVNNPLIAMDRHKRIKIFNDFAKGFGNVRIPYYSYLGKVVISNLRAETINVNNGKTEIVQLDKKQIYTEKIDNWYSTLVFAFPNIQAGSIIELKYTITSPGIPVWYFQDYVPTRYSEIEINIPSFYNFKNVPFTRQPYAKSVGEGEDAHQVRVMTNVHSMPGEPYMGSREGNLQKIEYIPINSDMGTWSKIGHELMLYNDFGYDLDRNLAGESKIMEKAKSLKSEDERIAFIFDTVRNRMKWNLGLEFYTIDGTVKAWDNSTGNSAEINMMVFHLLKKAGIKANPVLVCTKENGKVNPVNPGLDKFNNLVVYVQVDSTKNYVLDATQKYNLYNTMPENILNTFGLNIDVHDALSVNYADNLKAFNMVFIANEEPAMQSVYLNAEIKPDGKMDGSAEITSYTYNKAKALRLYQVNTEEKYLDTLRDHDNSVKIKSFKRENMTLDSLPLVQKVDFSMDLTGSDDKYIYFNTNLFNQARKNPFYSEERFSDIDFGYLDNFSLYGVYKLPDGYKTDVLPKSVTLVMPDQSIIFKRTVAEDNGTVLVKYVLSHKKSIYFLENYQDVHEFYKKMYELLAEQVVVKKT
jgi:Domain of Unknown Function with PDB structure (DUF3857)